MLSDIPLYTLLLWFCLCPLAIVSRQDAFGLVLASGDIGMPHCRQLETFNTLILFNKNDFGLSLVLRRHICRRQVIAAERAMSGMKRSAEIKSVLIQLIRLFA
ncbi:hypothetical protein [Serratia liquefaciens]|uniref:hypothetical protein n=1 Tax=Serratia liquefaciens TaxID=614 RepID=UPI00095F5C16|nr:hypothetical protein [Serratia liquefaciens]OKP21650.1 hypothetical protein BSQ35_12560 [Serratia liquefaciens]